MSKDGQPQFSQLQTKPLAVRIESLPTGQFVADRNNFCESIAQVRHRARLELPDVAKCDVLLRFVPEFKRNGELAMPITINGIGTHYYFKRNLVTNPGVCEHCHRPATLSDYDVGLFFVVLYLPVIPLGRQMIIGECNACNMHRVMPLKQWEQLREEAISSGLDRLGQAPNSAEAALSLLGIYATFNQLSDAWDLASAIRRSHENDYDTMLSLGSWFEARQHEAEANDCFQAAVRLDPDRISSKRIRLFDAMESKRINEVQALANSLLDDGHGGHQAVLHLAAKFLTQQQKYDEAYTLFKKLIEKYPDLKKEKEFRRSAREAEQGVGLPTTLVPAKKLGMLD